MTVTPIEPVILYFGEPWPAQMFADGSPRQIDTPVGEPCWYCETVVAEGDDGVMQITTERLGGLVSGWRIKPRSIHKECQLRSILGSLDDLTGHCEYPGHCNELREAAGISIREDALLVWDWLQHRPRLDG